LGTDRSAELGDEQEGATYCARHPSVVTYLRCSRCNTPICPRCLIQTPVGARCRECANVSRLPTFNVTPVYLARAFVAALVSGLAVGWFWELITPRFGFGIFLAVFIGLGVGWIISEAVSLATNRKLGLGLQLVAVMGVAIAFLFQQFLLPGNDIDFGSLIAAGVGVFFAASRLKIG
jgi:hypothetical protein